VVGSYSALVPARDLADSSGEGPTRDGKQKPEVSAPGVNIMAAKSLSQTTTRMSGTSMAAPHVTGLVALLLQAAPTADIAQLRRFILGGARRSPAGQMAWHARYGEGRVDVSACLTALAIQPAGLLAVPAGATSASPSNGMVTSVGEPVGTPAGSSGESVLLQLIETLSQTAHARQARVRIQIEVEPLSM
jgi:subtilisin family serine protease